MVICKNCRAQLDGSDLVCRYCGTARSCVCSAAEGTR